MLWKNKMSPVSSGLKEPPMLTIATGAVVRKNLEYITASEAQSKAPDLINGDCLVSVNKSPALRAVVG
jgi:hypothetical protein